MSIPVEVVELPAVLGGFDSAYLLTSDDRGRVKAVSVVVQHEGERIRARAPGGGSLRNLAVNDGATLLLPPRTVGEHTLLVDGTATADGDDALLTPTSAVLHRAALR